jgi:hypothetical protein
MNASDGGGDKWPETGQLPRNTCPYGDIMKPFLRNSLLAVAIAVLALWWFKPGFIELDIRVIDHQGGVAFWSEKQYSKLVYSDERGELYLYRQIARAYPERQGWNTIDDVFAFFDEALRRHGWTPGGEIAGISTSPESRLLPQASLRTYIKTEDSKSEPRLHLAVWPIGGAVEGFHIVFTTVNPSLLKRFVAGFD